MRVPCNCISSDHSGAARMLLYYWMSWNAQYGCFCVIWIGQEAEAVIGGREYCCRSCPSTQQCRPITGRLQVPSRLQHQFLSHPRNVLESSTDWPSRFHSVNAILGGSQGHIMHHINTSYWKTCSISILGNFSLTMPPR